MIVNLLNADRDQYHKVMEADYKWQEFWQKHHSKWWFKIVVFWQWFNPAVYINRLICKLTDHKWVDDSYGGPDSGCMAAHCERCDYSFHHQLY